MDGEEIKESITHACERIEGYREMLKEGGAGRSIPQIKENIHYWTGYRHAFEEVLERVKKDKDNE